MSKIHFLASLLAAVACVPAPAQTSKALISGIVTDGSGAAIANAKVTITDTQRNQDFRTETNSSGVYRLIELTPSLYRVTAEAAGFRTYVLESLPLSTQQNATLNIKLEIGAVSERVEVTATGPLLEASSATLSSVVENKKIIDLPLNNRNIYSLLKLVPGITPSTPNSESDFFTSTIRFSINGGKESLNDIQLDGVTAMVQSDIQGIYGASAIPSVEGIQEFRVQTNSYTAEYGRSGGGQVTMVTKSGNNNYHGSAFEFLRNSAMDAKSFFLNRSNGRKASFQQHQYGASAGGPIKKDRTFFFALYEKRLVKSGSFSQFTVPTAQQLSGDFSNTRNANGTVRTIFDPSTTRVNPADPTKFIRSPFAGNLIPSSRFDPVALNAVKFWPASNQAGQVNTNQLNLAIQKVPRSPTDRVDFKVDHIFSLNRRLFVRYNRFKQATGAADFWDNGAAPSDGIMYWGSHNAAIDYTETIGPAMVLNIRGGLSLFDAWRPAFSYGFDVTKLGLPAALQDVTLKTGAPRIPRFDVQDYTSIGPNNGSTYKSNNVAYTLVGNLTKISGKHSMKFGGEWRTFALGFAQFGSSPANFSFTRAMTQGPDPRVAGGGDGLASFLLGTGTSGAATHRIKPADLSRYYALYVQDDYKINAKLTVNVGLRWEIEGANTERYDQQTIMDPYAKNPLSDKTGLDLRGVYLFAGEGQSYGRRGVRAAEHKLNPRIGLAYQLNQKTVIRTGYGIFYGVPKFAATDRWTGAPYASTTPWLSTLDGINPNNLLRNPFPQGYVLPVGRSLGALSGVGFGLNSAWATEMRTPYNQQWNFTVQRHLSNNMMVELAYAGNKGTHNELAQGDLGQLNPNLLRVENRLLDLVPNPFFGLIDPSSVMGQATVQRGRLLRGQYAEFNSVGPGSPAWGNSNYHAMQSRFERRFGGGTSLMVSYTWSKSIADSSDGIWNDSQGTLRNWYCRNCERSLSSYDIPHRAVFNFNYELPFGRGKRYGASLHWLANAMLGGWQTNGIFTIGSGQPLAFTQTTNNSFSFGGYQRPDSTGVDARIAVRSIDRWYDTTQFRVSRDYTFGNLGRRHSNLRTDFTRGLDFSMFKNTRFSERFNLQFRAEAFNLTNTPVFAGPNTNVESGGFGTVTGQSNGPRSVQLGLKLLF
ncbi:MAG: carboxypeptidase regulatory-like domain-containing protein [Acidobacteria bacterium]|nr:carboxypeptidase regulatory-like domain-containing protein [Acidobacteriota bacterium]